MEVLYFLVFLFFEWSHTLCNYKLLVTSFAAWLRPVLQALIHPAIDQEAAQRDYTFHPYFTKKIITLWC